MQFPLINFLEPVTKRGKARVEVTTTFSVLIGETEIVKIRETLTTGLYDNVTMIESCWDRQVKRRYTIEDAKVVRGVFFGPTDYECRNPLPLRVPKEL